MKQVYNFDVDKIKSLSNEEKVLRKKDLNTFLETGFPGKRNEDWKFTDLNTIINKNFDKITNDFEFNLNTKIKILQNFEHNYIVLTNGILSSSNFDYEDKNKIEIKNFKGIESDVQMIPNTLALLNNALSLGGYSLKISENYKFKKPLVIYNYFSENLKNVIFNNKNNRKLPNHGHIERLVQHPLTRSTISKETQGDMVFFSVLISKSNSSS